jgi:hypothetical protein
MLLRFSIALLMSRGSIIAYIKLSKNIIANPFMASQDTTNQDKANYSHNV